MPMRLVAISVLLSLAPLAHADFGVGGSVGADRSSILFPIELRSLMLEPYVGYSNSDSSVNSVDTEERLVGMGVFGLAHRSDDVSFYFGARFAAFEGEITSGNSTWASPASRMKSDGQLVTPTFGIQYTLNQVSFGAELGWEYKEVDWNTVTETDFGPGFIEYSRTETSRTTQASIVFRYFFRN